MAEKMLSRSSTTMELFQETFVEVPEFKPSGKLPSGTMVIGRMLHLCKKDAKGQTKCLSKGEASKIVADELRMEWIKKNVYPLHETRVAEKIFKNYDHFNKLRKAEKCTGKKKSEKWYKDARDFVNSLIQNAYNIRTKDKVYQKKLEEEFGVKMMKDDEDFYEDNCLGSYKAICSSTVPKDWIKQKKRKESREISNENKRAATESKIEEQKQINAKEIRHVLEQPIECLNDPSFEEPQTLNNIPSTDYNLRTPIDSSTFPQVRIRKGNRTLNECLMRCVTQCLAETRMSPVEVSKVIVNVANMVFGQNWVTNNEKENTNDNDENENKELDESNEPRDSTSMKPEVFPIQRTIMKSLQDASYITLEYVARQILSKEDKVVTVGLDDTIKAAGHRMYDVKADHITIKGPSSKRLTVTTGYVENISHSGEDGAKAYEFKLKCLAILSNSTVDEVKSAIDFWMTDRAGECDSLLQNLGVDQSKMLKCSAHIILGIDHAIDKVYRNFEQKIGVQKLLEVTGGEKIFLSPSNSIHTLGLIAIAKLLSPSHAQHSVSLYTDFKSWLSENNLECHKFKGFVANRFGRIAELAKEYLSWRKSIQDFFNAIVDISSNKLVLAVSTFIQNEWFTCCTEIYSMIGDLIIFPLMELLGIDKMGEKNKEERTWVGVERFLNNKLSQLDQLMKDLRDPHNSGKDKFKAAVIEEIIDTVKNQMSKTEYFTRSNDEDREKMKHAPLTNLGCESEFSRLDHRIKASGGSTSIQAHSRKNMVVSSGILVNSEFECKTSDEWKLKWNWVRGSKEVNKVKSLEEDFLAEVRVANKLAIHKKEELKKKKTSKTLAVLERCKKHGGPMTPASLNLLPKLNGKQLLDEISYLRLTVAPDIRQMRRIKDGDGKYKMQKFTITELKTSIKNALKPEGNVSSDIDNLLLNAMQK